MFLETIVDIIEVPMKMRFYSILFCCLSLATPPYNVSPSDEKYIKYHESIPL